MNQEPGRAAPGVAIWIGVGGGVCRAVATVGAEVVNAPVKWLTTKNVTTAPIKEKIATARRSSGRLPRGT